MGSNTLGAIVFLAAGTWLGWTVLSGRAQQFLAAMGHGSSSAGGGGGGGAGTPPSPTVPQGGPVAGAGFNFGDQLSPLNLNAPIPNVFGGAFGENGSLHAPQYEGAYGPYSPNEGAAYDPLQYIPGALNPAGAVFGTP